MQYGSIFVNFLAHSPFTVQLNDTSNMTYLEFFC